MRYAVGDVVTVALPKGRNKRGVVGISVLFSTAMEARFDGATGTVTGVNPIGPYGLPQYLVDFRPHKNRVAIPTQAGWFREEWLQPAGAPRTGVAAVPPKPSAAAGGEFAAASGQQQTTVAGEVAEPIGMRAGATIGTPAGASSARNAADPPAQSVTPANATATTTAAPVATPVAAPVGRDATVGRPGSVPGKGRTTCPEGYLIKGSAAKLYYRPGRPAYAETAAVVCFASVADAEAAGFTPAPRR